MSFRLNKTDKEKLTNALLKAKFDPIGKKLQNDLNTLADEAYKKLIEPYKAHLETLPKEWVRHGKDVYLCMSDNKYNRRSAYFQETRILPRIDSYDAKIKLDLPLSAKFEKIRHRESSANEDHRNLKAEVEAALAQITTSKRALEVWPELEPFLEKLGKAETSNLPAIQRSDLNKKLGLKAVK